MTTLPPRAARASLSRQRLRSAIVAAMPSRVNKSRCCGFRGKNAFKDQKLHAPCASATGGPCHLMTRCRSCLGGNPLFVCLLCWSNVQSSVKSYIQKRARKARPIEDPVLDALCTTDFMSLHAAAIDAKRQGRQPVRAQSRAALLGCWAVGLLGCISSLSPRPRARQGPLGDAVLTRMKSGEGGGYHAWLDWVAGCPLCYNPTFGPPAPVLVAHEKQALAVVLKEQVLRHELGLLNDYGEEILMRVHGASRVAACVGLAGCPGCPG